MLRAASFDQLRVAILCSRRAPGIESVLRHPQRGKLYDVACVITSEPELVSRDVIERADVPLLTHPIHRFHDECGTSMRDFETRRAYDAMTVHVLRILEVNAVLLLGYLFVLTDVVLNAFPERVVNIHDSDLAILQPDGSRRYVGLHSTRDAVIAGEPATRSTAHLVTPQLDGGPILARSREYPVAPFAQRAARAGHVDIVRAYSYAQREWMMRDSWGDLAVHALELLSAGVTQEEVAV